MSPAGCGGELRGSPGHSPGMRGTGMLFGKRLRYPGHPILKHKPLCSPVLVPAVALCQDIAGHKFYSLSFQRSGCSAGPGWVLQDLRSKRRTRAGTEIPARRPTAGLLLAPRGGKCKLDAEILAERTPAACTVLPTRAHLHARLTRESRGQRHCSSRLSTTGELP